jgi:phospholipid transport system substrate-binding protein
MYRRHLLVAAAALSLLRASGSAAAPVAADPAQFVEMLGQKAIARLADSALSQRELHERFRQLLEEYFEIATVGRLTAGAYWNSATKQQQQTYLELFETQLIDGYAERFRAYAGEKFTVIGQRAESERDTIVASQILRVSGPPVHVEWRVRRSEKGLGVIDIAVEGVSMATTQRAEFATVIERGGGNFESLIQALRQRSLASASK